MTDINLPQFSESMERGTIIKWLKEDGQSVAVGDELVEIETDKAAVAYSSEADGILHILLPEGSVCEVGTAIARLDDPDQVADSPERAEPQIDNTVTAPLQSAPVPAVSMANGGHVIGAWSDTEHGSASLQATPLARRAAAIHEISLDSVPGTGPKGRITHKDVLSAAGVTLPSASPAEPARPPAPPLPLSTVTGTGEKGVVSLQSLSRLQKVVVSRMAEANTNVPQFQVQTEVNVEEAFALRSKWKSLEGVSIVPSINDLIIKACALALQHHPLANGTYTDEGFELYSRINIGFAAAAERALLVPTIFDADSKSLGTIAAETRELSERVRSGTIAPADLSGGTFTVSNLGMYGMTAITPLINVPQAAILGVGGPREVLARVGDEIVSRTFLTLTLSCDHRILYGADAANLLAEIQKLLESPLSLVL